MMASEPKKMIKQQLLSDHAELPTGVLSRLRRSGMSVWRARQLIRALAKQDAEGALDEKRLVKRITSIGALKGLAMKSAQLMSDIDIALPQALRDALAVSRWHVSFRASQWMEGQP